MVSASDIRKDMEVVGSDEKHVGRVDHMDGSQTIKLAKQDSAADGQHHHIPIDWVDRIEDQKACLNISADEAMQRWETV